MGCLLALARRCALGRRLMGHGTLVPTGLTDMVPHKILTFIGILDFQKKLLHWNLRVSECPVHGIDHKETARCEVPTGLVLALRQLDVFEASQCLKDNAAGDEVHLCKGIILFTDNAI